MRTWWSWPVSAVVRSHLLRYDGRRTSSSWRHFRRQSLKMVSPQLVLSHLCLPLMTMARILSVLVSIQNSPPSTQLKTNGLLTFTVSGSHFAVFDSMTLTYGAMALLPYWLLCRLTTVITDHGIGLSLTRHCRREQCLLRMQREGKQFCAKCQMVVPVVGGLQVDLN